MKPIEIFKNLVEPLKSKLDKDSWNFLMERAAIFILQCIPNASPTKDEQDDRYLLE